MAIHEIEAIIVAETLRYNERDMWHLIQHYQLFEAMVECLRSDSVVNQHAALRLLDRVCHLYWPSFDVQLQATESFLEDGLVRLLYSDGTRTN